MVGNPVVAFFEALKKQFLNSGSEGTATASSANGSGTDGQTSSTQSSAQNTNQSRSRSLGDESPQQDRALTPEQQQQRFNDMLKLQVRNDTHMRGLSQELTQHVQAGASAEMSGMQSRTNMNDVIERNIAAVAGIPQDVLKMAREAAAAGAAVMSGRAQGTYVALADNQQQRGASMAV
jgi:hypothetical protein